MARDGTAGYQKGNCRIAGAKFEPNLLTLMRHLTWMVLWRSVVLRGEGSQVLSPDNFMIPNKDRFMNIIKVCGRQAVIL